MDQYGSHSATTAGGYGTTGASQSSYSANGYGQNSYGSAAMASTGYAAGTEYDTSHYDYRYVSREWFDHWSLELPELE